MISIETCTFETVITTFFEFEVIDSGTCSMETEELLVKQECIQEVFSQPRFVQNTILTLIYVSCNDNVSDIYVDFQQQIYGRDLSNFKNIDIKGGSENTIGRLAPNQQVLKFINFTKKKQLDYD